MAIKGAHLLQMGTVNIVSGLETNEVTCSYTNCLHQLKASIAVYVSATLTNKPPWLEKGS